MFAPLYKNEYVHDEVNSRLSQFCERVEKRHSIKMKPLSPSVPSKTTSKAARYSCPCACYEVRSSKPRNQVGVVRVIHRSL